MFVFLWFTSLSMTISRSIHVASNGIISFFFMAEGALGWSQVSACFLFPAACNKNRMKNGETHIHVLWGTA